MNRQAEASIAPKQSPPQTGVERKVDAHPAAATRSPLVAAVIVTWNRSDMAARALEAMSRQSYDLSRLHVIVVDNASSDGTIDHLSGAFNPERIVENHAKAAHEPDFQPAQERGGRNSCGFASLTLVRNQENFGGCGGFNTGFHYVASLVADGEPVDYIWLFDDDAESAPDSLKALTDAAATDPKIGVVGSRTVDSTDHQRTIESTIYFDFNRGRMGPTPTANHRLRASHDAWIEEVGGTKGRRDLKGVRDVDVVSACSLLARWSAVEKVGFWDERYFIYCDDADWCLRMGKAGYRVVCNLDAVVYHTPWIMKLTPARLYYAQRNLIYTMQKVLPKGRLRYATFRWMLAMSRQSIVAACTNRRLHAAVLQRTIRDIIAGRAGKIDFDAQEFVADLDALADAGTIVAVCTSKKALERVTELRGRAGDNANWIELVANHVPGAYAAPNPPGAERIVYSRRWRSRLRRQLQMLRVRPDAVVIVDNVSNFPLWRSTRTIHLDRDKPGEARIERDGLMRRLTSVGAALLGLPRIAWFCAVMRPTDR